MGRLTTHILDTTRGKPGSNINVALHQVDGEKRTLIKKVTTNDDGRVDSPILEGNEFTRGVYELVFSVGPYFKKTNDSAVATSTDPLFLDDVVIRFGIAAPDEHYHVPLLITPYSYSTYRGS